MKRKDVEQVYHLKRELRKWQSELVRLQADIALSPKPMDGMPHSNKISSPSEEKAIKLADTQKIIEGKIAEIQFTVTEIDVFITTIDNSLTRQIVYDRCVRCLSWKEIAFEMGEGYSDETVRQHYHRFVKTLEK